MGLPGRILDQFIACHVWGYGGPALGSACHLQTQRDCALVSEVTACARVTLSSCLYACMEQPQSSYSLTPFFAFLLYSVLYLLRTVASV